MTYKVSYVDLPKQYALQREEILEAFDQTMAEGKYILGEAVQQFENNFAKLCNTKYAVSVANGTDALILSLKALGIGPGDEVITVSNSWISSASSIALVGATPIFVDVRQDQNVDPYKLGHVVTPDTKAIIPVHLTGKCADMDPIIQFAQNHNLSVIEDAAQAVGAKYKGKMAGSMGHLGCFSLHPLKNLNGAGDGGIIVTNDKQLTQKLKLLRNHGLESRDKVVFWGLNSRLDTIQAAILNYRLNKLESVISRKRENAKIYLENLDKNNLILPNENQDEFNTYHTFVIQTDKRDKLKDYMYNNGVETLVHYPTPIHLQPAAAFLGCRKGDLPVTEDLAKRILTLPIHQYLSEDDIKYVSKSINDFF